MAASFRGSFTHGSLTSHRQIVEQVRHELALRYLVETAMPIKEVSALLGYSELRAFYRAFERWTGLAPRRLPPHGAVNG